VPAEEDSGPHRLVERASIMNTTHLGERRFAQRPRCLDAEVAVAPKAALARGLWVTALVLVALGIAALIVTA